MHLIFVSDKPRESFSRFLSSFSYEGIHVVREIVSPYKLSRYLAHLCTCIFPKEIILSIDISGMPLSRPQDTRDGSVVQCCFLFLALHSNPCVRAFSLARKDSHATAYRWNICDLDTGHTFCVAPTRLMPTGTSDVEPATVLNAISLEMTSAGPRAQYAVASVRPQRPLCLEALGSEPPSPSVTRA